MYKISDRKIIGIDIGGSHISCAAINIKEDKLIPKSFSYQKVNNQAKASTIINNWALAINKTIASCHASTISGIGFAIPGPFDYEKGIAQYTGANAKFGKLRGLDVSNALRPLLKIEKNISIRYINDASAFGLGIANSIYGGIEGRILVVTLGTGLGASFIENGQPLNKHLDIPEGGSLWQLPYGSILADEAFSSRGIIKRYKQLSKRSVNDVKELTLRVGKDEFASETFHRFGLELGTFLAPWLNRYKPHSLIFSGNISNAFPHFEDDLYKGLGPTAKGMSIKTSLLGEQAAILGAASIFTKDPSTLFS